MKTKSMLVAGLSLCLLAAMSVGTMSCKKSDPVPEDVTNPLDEEVYYITGKVTEGTAALSGVSVKVSGGEASTATDGTYTLSVKKKGDYQVSFEKSGYISVSGTATIPSSAAKRSSVALSQTLTKANAPVTVTKDKAVDIHSGVSQEKSVTTLQVPAGAVKEDVAVTVTEYVPGAQKATSTAIASLSTINCQPDGLVFEKLVTVLVKNPTNPTVHFENVAHYKEVNGAWQKQGVASYDTQSNSYMVELTGFSNHSFGPTYTIASTGTSSEKLADVVVDNLGVMEAKEADVAGKQKFGWQIDGDLKALLQKSFPSLSSEDQATLAASIESAIASSKGSNAGVTETALSLGKAKVGGDMKMTVSFTAKVAETTGTFKLSYNGASTNLVVPVKTYNGVDTKITYEQGNSRPDHSGGGGN